MKQYFTGFFTAVCLTASAFLFMGAQNKNLGDITVDSITLTDENYRCTISPDGINIGKRDGSFYGLMATMSCSDTGGMLGLFNSNDKVIVNLGSSDDGNGFFTTHHKDGTVVTILGSKDDGDGSLLINNANGKQASSLIYAGNLQRCRCKNWILWDR